jgi:hypothetical protein
MFMLRYRHIMRAMFVLATLASAEAAFAGGGPENVAVIVNGDSWASRAIANEFAALRQIPPSNIIIIDGVPDFEQVTVEEFRTHLLQPVIDEVTARGLERQIDIIAWSCDFPWAIDIRGDAGTTILPQYATPIASITGLTYLYGLVLARNINYVSLGSNYYYRRPDMPRDDVEWTEPSQREYQQAVESLQKRENLGEAERILAHASAEHPESATTAYNLACIKAVLGKHAEALDALSRAVELGWSDAEHTQSDEDLASLRALPEFARLVEQMQVERLFSVAQTIGFRHEYGFGPAGEKVEPHSGAHYALSTMLAVTSGRGLSVQEALDSLARSAAADETRPDGTFYFMRNRDVRSQTRQWGFASAVALLRQAGRSAEIVEGELPRGRGDILGLMAGSASFDFPASGSAILPGAICEHLTSFGGIMREGAGQTPLTEFIRAGAAGASGTVHEPYSIQAKFPDPFIQVHYARGCSLAESFYQSVAGPYQLLIVGDPLCAPWATSPRLALDGLRGAEVVGGTIEVKPRLLDDRRVNHLDLFIDGRLTGRFETADPVQIETDLLSDGWHELRFVAVADDLVETQGRVMTPIVVNNSGRRARIVVDRREASLDQEIEARVDAPGALHIEIVHCGKTVAVIEGERGSATIPARLLGMGPSLLQAHATFAENSTPDRAPTEARARLGPLNVVHSEPIEVRITAGKPLRPTGRGALNRELQPGLLITTESGERAVATETREPNWLTIEGVPHDETITLEGWLRVEEDGLHQLQLRTPRRMSLEVNGSPAGGLEETADWQFVPLYLARGLHSIKLILDGPGPPELAIRLGLRGCQALDGRRVRYRP